MVPPEPAGRPGGRGRPPATARRRRDGPASRRSGRRPGPTATACSRTTDLRKGEGAKLYASFRKDLGRAAKASPWFRDDPTRLTNLWHGLGIGALVLAAVVAFIAVFEDGVDGRHHVRLHAEPMGFGSPSSPSARSS